MAFGFNRAVSKARQILPGMTYLITRRTILRHMLLRPDSAMTQVVIYCLGVAAFAHNVQVHALCAMSTHIHLVATDVDGNLPKFLHAFHLYVARCTQALRDWNAPVWDDSPTSAVRLATPQAIVEKIAYVLANPVAAGLVPRACEWPGAKVLVDDIGTATLRARRPSVYFNPDNTPWPDESELPISLPPGIEPAQSKVFREWVTDEVAVFEAAAQAEMQEQAREFLGPELAPEVLPTLRATTPEPKSDCNPTFAVGRQQKDAFRSAVAAMRAFRAAYRAALEQWRAGIRSVVFPAGTWLMRVLHHADVDAAVPAG